MNTLLCQRNKGSYKINSQTSLTLSMDVNIKGATDKGDFEELIIPNLVIPLML